MDLEGLLRDLAPRLLAYCRSRTSSDDLAAEVAQDALTVLPWSMVASCAMGNSANFLRRERFMAEYQALRDELANNKKFVFGRPLIIIGAAYGALWATEVPPMFSGAIEATLVILLTFNLWFTSNRLRGGARIIGYLRVVHESGSLHNWIGWETALARYRDWCLHNPKTVAEIRRKHRERDKYDRMGFYTPIYYLHILLSFIAVINSFATSLLEDFKWVGFSSLPPGPLIVLAVFLVACLFMYRWRPRIDRRSVNAEAELWQKILDSQSYLDRLYGHLDWANSRVLKLLQDSPNKEAVRLFSHLLGTEDVWLARIEESYDPSTIPIWPDLSVDECTDLADQNRRRFRSLLGEATAKILSEPIRYANSQGTKFETSLEDILTHVALHGAYHRGQIVRSLRDAGVEPVNTDFITFARPHGRPSSGPT